MIYATERVTKGERIYFPLPMQEVQGTNYYILQLLLFLDAGLVPYFSYILPQFFGCRRLNLKRQLDNNSVITIWVHDATEQTSLRDKIRLLT